MPLWCALLVNLVGDSLIIISLAGQSVELPSAMIMARYSGITFSGDTVRFDAQRFADGRERDVADLLRQLPGVEVDEQGAVTYLGKKVDRFLLNGQDVLRSQFSALNALIGSAEIKSAEIVTERVKLSAPETQTLNLNTKGGKALRVDAQLGISSHGDGLGSTTLLYAPKEGWQLFGTLGYDGTGGSAISSQDFQKQYDWGLRSARDETSLGGGTQYFVFGSDLNHQAARRDHYAAQATASRVHGDAKTSFFGRYTRADELERGQEELFDSRTGKLIGLLDRSKVLMRESMMLTGSHTDTSVARLSVELYAGLLFDGQDILSTGMSRFSSDTAGGASSGAYAFRQNLPRPGGYITGFADYEINERWSARITGDYQGSRERGDWSFGDSYKIFGIAEVDTSAQPFALHFDTQRNTDQSLGDARLTYKGDSLSLPLIAQFRQRSWHERLISDPSSEYQRADLLPQRENTYTLAADPKWQFGKLTISSTVGLQQIDYSRGSLHNSRTAPLLFC